MTLQEIDPSKMDAEIIGNDIVLMGNVTVTFEGAGDLLEQEAEDYCADNNIGYISHDDGVTQFNIRKDDMNDYINDNIKRWAGELLADGKGVITFE